MKTFNDLKFNRTVTPYGSMERARLQFSNEYGISVVRGTYSYGGDEGLYECAVLKNDELCYDTPITDDVIGYCDEDKVNEIIKQIQELWYDDKISIVLDNDLPCMEKFDSKEECNKRYLYILDCISYYPKSY